MAPVAKGLTQLTPKASNELCAFLAEAVTPWHAVACLAKALERSGFERISPTYDWELRTGSCYYFIREGTLVAFKHSETGGWRIVGTHTDSPNLRLKQHAAKYEEGVWKLGVEVYGGALLAPWFDRDLSLAGRVVVDSGQKQETLCIDLARPLACIPSLAIHLDRNVNSERNINPQEQMSALLSDATDTDNPLNPLPGLISEGLARLGIESQTPVLASELCLYDTQPPAILGGQWLCSARLDNLLSCFMAAKALMDPQTPAGSILVCHDHEEVGSNSAVGAQSPLLLDTLTALGSNIQRRVSSVFLSVDNAHAVHPNFSDRHDAQHRPQLNHGVVIKFNSNQRYATAPEEVARFRHICAGRDIPLQDMVARADMACGSTLGPISAARAGISTLDIGVPQWAMHSVRETCGLKDAFWLQDSIQSFYAHWEQGA